jgi:hypothetical protein
LLKKGGYAIEDEKSAKRSRPWRIARKRDIEDIENSSDDE